MLPSVIYLFSFLNTGTAFMVIVQFIGLVSLILLGWELRVLYHCTMCTRYPDLVSLFYAIPIFHILYIYYLSPLIFKLI